LRAYYAFGVASTTCRCVTAGESCLVAEDLQARSYGAAAHHLRA
jgi:hypothetical protein